MIREVLLKGICLIMMFLVIQIQYSCSDTMIMEENDNTPKVPDAFAAQKTMSDELREETYDYEYHTNITQGNSLDDLDRYAAETPDEYTESIEKLAKYLMIPAENEIHKARVIFSWVAQHISYDDEAYNKGEYGATTAEGVLKAKKAVCEGYSNLFSSLCNASGLTARKVVGYSKGYGYIPGQKMGESDHAWNVVRINEKWRLFDVTWASGSANTSREGNIKSTNNFDDYWFIVNPREFIFTHLPEQSSWQLLPLAERLNITQFENLPYIRSSFFKIWFNTKYIYDNAKSGRTKQFAISYAIDYPVKITKMPSSLEIADSKIYNLEIESSDASEVVVINNGKFIPFTKNGNIYTLKYKPKAGTLHISARFRDEVEYSTFLKYKVLKGQNI